MTEPSRKPPPIVAICFGMLGLIAGLHAFFQAGLRGHSAGWDMMAIYSVPAIVCALVAIAIWRGAWTYAGLVGGALAIAALWLGW